MGERSEAVKQECEAELDSIAARLCTALTTLRDYPAIRYRVGKPPEAGDAPGASVRSLVAQRLAQKVGGGLVGDLTRFCVGSAPTPAVSRQPALLGLLGLHGTMAWN
jgi:hypothetical protein